MNKRKINKLMGIILSFGILFSTFNINTHAQTNNAIYASIEDHVNGVFILEPISYDLDPNLGNYLRVEKAIDDIAKAHQLNVNMGFGSDFSWIVKGINDTQNTDTHQWYIFANNQLVDDLWFTYETLENGGVLRLVYASKESLPLMSSHHQSLIRNLGIIPNDKRVELNETYQDGLHLVLDENTSKEQVDAYLETLTQALNPMIPTESLDFDPKSYSLNVSETAQLKVERYPLNSTDELIWTSLNPSIASVDQTGIIKGHDEGEVIIQVTSGTKIAQVSIQVKHIKIQTINFNESNITLYEGEKRALDLNIAPQNATQKPHYTVQDESILRIDQSGHVIALKSGSTLVRASVGELSSDILVHVEKRDNVDVPTVVFKHENGQLIYANENNEFELSSLDEGQFILLGAQDIDFVEGIPFWDASEKITNGLTSFTHYWILADGTFVPYKPSTIIARVYDRSYASGTPQEIMQFTIKTKSSNIVELKAYIDEKEIKENAIYNLFGSEHKEITFKGRQENESEFVTIPKHALSYKETHLSYGYIVNGKFGMNTGYDLPKDAQAHYLISMLDTSASFQFKAISEVVHVEEMDVNLPNMVYIDAWNGLANQYIGVLPNVTISPDHASNHKLNWENLTPEIAEYMPAHNNGIVPKKEGRHPFK